MDDKQLDLFHRCYEKLAEHSRGDLKQGLPDVESPEMEELDDASKK